MSWSTALRRPLAVFAAPSLLAVATGAVVCALSGVPASLWGRNLAVWLAGGMAATALARWAGVRTLQAFAAATPLVVAAPLLFAGQEGVHRWLDLGPLYVNAAMLVLPAFVVALAVLAQASALWWIAAIATLIVLVVQPDASQATALAVASVAAAVAMRGRAAALRAGLALVAVLLAALSWTRPDPLAPVPEVEEVVRLAAAQSPWLAALCVLALAAFTAAPVLATRGHVEGTVSRAGLALGALFAVWSLAPALGAFPTPLVGVGVSPILGAWLGVGLLAAVARRAGTTETPGR